MSSHIVFMMSVSLADYMIHDVRQNVNSFYTNFAVLMIIDDIS